MVGQDRAVRRLARVYQVYLAGLSTPGRPLVNLLFLGPTGSGKTRLVEAAAEVLMGDSKAVVKVDCAEFQHSHEVAKLIGSPPGYVGHRETQPLITQEVLERHFSDESSFRWCCSTKSRKPLTPYGNFCSASWIRPPSPWATTGEWTFPAP